MNIYNMNEDTWYKIKISLGYDEDDDLLDAEIIEIDDYIRVTYGLDCLESRHSDTYFDCYDYTIVDPKKYTMFLLRWT